MATQRLTAYAAAMTHTLRAGLRIASALAALVLGTAAPAAFAASPPKPPAPSLQAIPLPLNPIIPAAQRLCTQAAASGLGSVVLTPAEGAKPGADDYALVNYIGYLAATGMVFDQGMRSAFPVGGVIPGFSEGLQMMTKGSIWRFCVPASLGYGDEASGPIPAGSDLVFQVELLDYKSPAEVDAMRAAAAAANGAQEQGVPAPR